MLLRSIMKTSSSLFFLKQFQGKEKNYLRKLLIGHFHAHLIAS